jgi:GT2 family glycosyltransferase
MACQANSIRLSKSEMTDASKVKTVSLIVPHCLDRADLLKRLLDSIPKSDSHLVIELLVSSEGNLSECRNKLAKKAEGEILVFLDDDIELRQNTLDELIDPFYSGHFSNVGVVGGVNIPFGDAEKKEILSDALLTNPITMFRSRARYTPIGNIRVSDESEVVTCLMAISRKAFEEVGGFPEDIIPCEENVLTNRIKAKGYSIIYNPFAVVYHRRPKLFKQYSRTVFNYGKGRGKMMRCKQGNPKLLFKPKIDWLYIVAGIIVHYISYISGLLYGYFTFKRKRDEP